MSITTTTSWPNDWNVDPDAFRSIAENMAALTAKVGDFQQLFYQTYAQHRQELPHLLTLMIAHSWYPDFEIPIADSRALEARAIAGDFPAVEHYLIEYFRRNASRLERGISDLYPDRAIVISTAFKAYSDGQYILAIPVFLAQADGVSKELLSKCFFTPRKSIREAQKLFQNGLLDDYSRLLLAPLVEFGTIRENTGNLVGKSNCLNRHAILHGIDLAYGTETNALKCISLLAYLLMVKMLKA
jgi:hypothetical protein